MINLHTKRFGWFTFEKHALCFCSICELVQKKNLKIGFLLPVSKTWNAWRWFYIKGSIGIRYYVRWAGFWKRRPERW